jgi:hypothetical protein
VRIITTCILLFLSHHEAPVHTFGVILCILFLVMVDFHETRVSSCIVTWLVSALFKFKCLFLEYFGEFSIRLVIVSCYPISNLSVCSWNILVNSLLDW